MKDPVLCKETSDKEQSKNNQRTHNEQFITLNSPPDKDFQHYEQLPQCLWITGLQGYPFNPTNEQNK